MARLQAQLHAIIKLSRWREHVPFTIPLTLVGGLLAVHLHGGAIDWRLGAVLLANILAMSFAFMINDVVDAPDDARNPEKRARNPISNGLLSPQIGWGVSLGIAGLALVLYLTGGLWVGLWGTLILMLSYAYSAPPFRLKSRFVFDVVSHILMLSGLLVVASYYIYHQEPGIVWLVVLAACLFSAYGQFYNQMEDYEGDKAAGLRNTVVVLGVTNTRLLGIASIIIAAISFLITVQQQIYPAWLGTVILVCVVTLLIFPWTRDMRGNTAEGGNQVQIPSLILANIVTLTWLAQSLGWLSI